MDVAGRGVIVDGDGNFVVTGDFEGVMACGEREPNGTRLVLEGEDDVFLAKWGKDRKSRSGQRWRVRPSSPAGRLQLSICAGFWANPGVSFRRRERPVLADLKHLPDAGRGSAIAILLPLGDRAKAPHSGARSRVAARDGSMLEAAIRHFGWWANTVEPVLLDQGLRREPEYPLYQTVGW